MLPLYLVSTKVIFQCLLQDANRYLGYRQKTKISLEMLCVANPTKIIDKLLLMQLYKNRYGQLKKT